MTVLDFLSVSNALGHHSIKMTPHKTRQKVFEIVHVDIGIGQRVPVTRTVKYLVTLLGVICEVTKKKKFCREKIER